MFASVLTGSLSDFLFYSALRNPKTRLCVQKRQKMGEIGQKMVFSHTQTVQSTYFEGFGPCGTTNVWENVEKRAKSGEFVRFRTQLRNSAGGWGGGWLGAMDSKRFGWRVVGVAGGWGGGCLGGQRDSLAAGCLGGRRGAWMVAAGILAAADSGRFGGSGWKYAEGRRKHMASAALEQLCGVY